MKGPLHLCYRPEAWNDVLGQDDVVDSIVAALQRGQSHAFLLVGPSGVGKTTIARLIARELGIDPATGDGYSEIDTATHTGVDDAREIKRVISMCPINDTGNRVVCMDECQMLSRNAWNSLLKVVEEPPPGVHWVFCTTELSKVPKPVRTRCSEYELRLVRTELIADRLDEICDKEGFVVSDEVLELIVQHAVGCPRDALVALGQLYDCVDIAAAKRVLETFGLTDNKDVADFCRALGRGAGWGDLCSILKRMEGITAEGVRNVVCVWFAKVALGSSTAHNAARPLAILDAFADPYPPCGASMHPVLISLGVLMGASGLED